jgi:hypothetical protein
MAKDKDENGDGGKTENVLAEAMKMLAENQRMMLENAPKRVITPDSPEYRELLVAAGHFDTFSVPVYQNGHEAEPRGLSAQTRERASTLVPGKYLGGKVTVETTPNGGIHIKYKSKTVEDRMSQPFGDFTDLVERVWAEMNQPVSA